MKFVPRSSLSNPARELVPWGVKLAGCTLARKTEVRKHFGSFSVQR
jgi:hypothetical protein